jgi:hypothetical protein
MANIRKHRDKWQVRIRRTGLRPLSKTFIQRKDALEWARQMRHDLLVRKACRLTLPACRSPLLQFHGIALTFKR